MRHDEILGLLHFLATPADSGLLRPLLLWEITLWITALLAAAFLWRLRPGWVFRTEEMLRRMGSHRAACAWTIGGSVLELRAMLLPLIPRPVPVVLDEFSYLLGADTFASGRIANPKHPMWLFFESININVRPTYQSMYPPAQAAVLAVGEKLLHSPWAGVLLSVALMCGLICWMLQGWLPPQWALLGGIYAVLRFGIFSYWINSYWGGAVAACGGALLLGSLARLRSKPCAAQALVFALGLIVLANSRPFEGFLFALPCCAALLWTLARSPLGLRLSARMLLPATLLLAVAATWMLYYNWRGTGHALLMPYSLNQATYHITRPFFFQKPYPIPHFNNPQLRSFFMLHEYPLLLRSRTRWGIEELMEQKLACYYAFLLWPLLLLFIPALLLAFRERKLRVVAAAVLLMTAGLMAQLWPAHGHYAAPAVAAIFLLQLNALRELRAQGTERALWLSRAIVLVVFLWMLSPICERLWNPYGFDDPAMASVPKEIDRARIEAQLSRTPGQHLVLVHYREHDVPSKEWVYNRADIDHATVVWARDMGDEANQPLLRYFAGRKVWYVDHSAAPVLLPYSTVLALNDPARTKLAPSR